MFSLPAVLVATDATPTHWVFYYQGAVSPLSISDSWSGSMCRVHIALQEPQAVALMLHQMALHLTDKVVASYLDNSTVKVYLHNQCDTVSLFFTD